MRELRENLIWTAAGAVVFWVELLLLSVSSNYELFKETVVLFVVPAALFWAINRYRKQTPFYFIKSVACIWIGRAVFDVVLFYVSGREATRFTVSWQVMLTILLFCMKIIQMVYDKIPDKKVYFGYVLLGTALAFNASYIASYIVSYIAREYDMVLQYARLLQGMVRDIYVLEHGAALLIAAVVIFYQYQRSYQVRIKNNEITKKAYLYNAIKMTCVSFLISVYPLYRMFLSE